MCEFKDTCKNKNSFVVNGRLREAQTQSCGLHLPSAVVEMAFFNDERYRRRHPDDKFAGTVFVINK